MYYHLLKIPRYTFKRKYTHFGKHSELSLEALLSQGQGEKDSLASTLPPCGAGGWYTPGRELTWMDKVLPPWDLWAFPDQGWPRNHLRCFWKIIMPSPHPLPYPSSQWSRLGPSPLKKLPSRVTKCREGWETPSKVTRGCWVNPFLSCHPWRSHAGAHTQFRRRKNLTQEYSLALSPGYFSFWSEFGTVSFMWSCCLPAFYSGMEGQQQLSCCWIQWTLLSY